LVSVTIVGASVIRIPLQHHAADVAGIRRAREQFAKHPKMNNNVKPEILLQSGFKPDFFSTVITLGTPPQAFRVAVETGNTIAWVNSIDSGRYFEKGNAYDQYASTTSSLINNYFSIRDGSYQVEGSYYSDVLGFGSLKSTNQVFGAANYVNAFEYYTEFPVDGVLGLSLSPTNSSAFASPIQGLLVQLDKPIFTVWVDSFTKYAGEGAITLGGLDSENCDSQVTYISLTPHAGAQSHYTFTTTHIAYGPYTHRGTYVTYADTGASILALPDAEYEAIFALIKPEYDYYTYLYTIDCSIGQFLPDFVFRIDGQQYNVDYKNYILDYGLESNKCVVAFGKNSNTYNQDLLLGTPFLRAFCSVYDFTNGQIGFAASIPQE